MENWKRYQEETAAFFRDLGLDAQTDVVLQGIRTSHDIDVVIRAHHVGFELLWIAECKHWKAPVKKVHVMALREIVSDVGADRGILMSEAGFQRGAYEASVLTNVQLTSLGELAETAGDELAMMQLLALYGRIEECDTRYWKLKKDDRIELELRPDVGVFGFSSTRVISAVKSRLNSALRGRFIDLEDDLVAMFEPELTGPVEGPKDLFDLLDPYVTDLEQRLDAAEAAIDRRQK